MREERRKKGKKKIEGKKWTEFEEEMLKIKRRNLEIKRN